MPAPAAGSTRRPRPGDNTLGHRMASASGEGPDRTTRTGAPVQPRSLLASVDGLVHDAHLREKLGDLGAAFSLAFGSWMEPIAAAMQGMVPTDRSQAAARSTAELARLTGAFARDAALALSDAEADGADSGTVEGYASLAARIDDSFRTFSSSPDFERARRHAAAAMLAWLEHDPTAASAVARALESPPAPARPHPAAWISTDSEVVLRDGNATLVRFPCTRTTRVSVLVIAGFTASAHLFDLDLDHSVARTLAQHGVDTWLLDWGHADETDRVRTVANQIDRIDRALDVVRAAANGRRPALAGHFHGGVLALLHGIRYPGKACALVTLSTPVEFASAGDAFADWLRACDGERLADIFGNIPGALVATLLAAASPMRWCGGGFFTLLDGVDSAAGAARVARFEHARRFPPGFPGETFRGLYRSFYRDNAFITTGGVEIDGRRYDLAGLAMPVLNVIARDDRIVPPGASAPLAALLEASPGSSREHYGGHFDLFTDRSVHTELLPDVAAWLTERSSGY